MDPGALTKAERASAQCVPAVRAGQAVAKSAGAIYSDNMGQQDFIAVDWGTTNRRAYRIRAGAVIGSVQDALGVTAVPAGGFEQEVARLREALGDAPMLLAGMVLSNLVEEKANKVIEVLAAAIPMDAVFLGKLAAMLGVSLVGIAVWGAVGSAIALLAGNALPQLPEPALGWPLFATLGLLYFAMGYLLLGSLFLTIGGMAATVREVQTLSMPVTMAQLLVFFLAASSITRPGSPIELFAAIFPLSSPFAMLARAAQSDALWPHALALGWQALCVILFVRFGAMIFRRRVMKSGKGGRARKPRFGRARSA